MNTEHPITPPNKLVQQWHIEWVRLKVKHVGLNEYIATQGARWGDDLRLEACRDWVGNHISALEAAELCVAMRPKPPSLAEQALDAQKRMWLGGSTDDDWELIRAALERLQELEKGNE